MRKALIFFALYILSSCVFADESLRIAGMGGAFAGISCVEGAIFGNPAGLIDVQCNNISAAFSIQNLDYVNLPSNNGEQLNTTISFRLNPSIYYSRAVGRFGIALGYVDDLNNNSSTLKIDATKAEYIVDERKFVSDTDTVLEYDFFREKIPAMSLGYSINPGLAIGIGLKYRDQKVKKGVIVRPLRLTSVHGADVNRNDATKLLPAIIDNLDIDDAIERFKCGEDSQDEVITDLSGSGFDFDFGIRTKIFRNISAGFVLNHIIQSRIVKPQSSEIRLGLGTMPLSWLTIAVDFQNVLDTRAFNVALGWEIDYRWQRWFSGGIIIRNGFAREASKNIISAGLGLLLGGSQWNYTIVKPLDDSSILKAAHMLSSTTRF